MKFRNIFSHLIIGSFFLLPFAAIAQDRDAMSSNEIARMDSLESVKMKADQDERINDEDRLEAAKLDRKQTKARSKDAKRVEREARNAARESKAEVRAEKKAQKSRKDAKKQAQRAEDARNKSNEN
jgi:hypothetical protein